MKNLNLSLMKAAIPITALFFSWSGQAAMEVKGFGLSEQDAILDVYGSCHRLEEPLVVRIYSNTDFVVGSNGWIFEISYRIAEEKKYTPDYFAADNDKMTGATGDGYLPLGDARFSGPDYDPGTGIYRMSYNSSNGGGSVNHVVLPTRNINYLSIRAHSKTNNRGGLFIWNDRQQNTLSGGWVNNPPNKVSYTGVISAGTGSFNLRNTDHLAITFVQTAGGVGYDPSWDIEAKGMTFKDRGPYTAAQYKQACQ